MSVLWSDSIELMLLGMGSVFTFLALLVVGVTIMSAVINRLSPPASTAAKKKAPQMANIDSEIAAVAAAAWASSHHSASPSKTS